MVHFFVFHLLLPIYVRTPYVFDNIGAMDKRFREGQKVTIISLLFNIFLAAGKGVVGVLGRSQALTADAVDSVSDVIATLFVLISLRISGKPKDPEHPYGHYKAEPIAAGIVGLIITAAAIAVIVTAILTIIRGDHTEPALITLYVAIAVIVIKEGLYRYVSRIGKKINSIAVMATASDHRKDALSAIATVIGITGARLGVLVLDPLAAIVVAFFILRIGFFVSFQSASELLDISPPKKIIEKIKKITLSINGIEHVADIRARKTGPYLIVDIKIEIDSQMSVADSHHSAGLVKREVMRQMSDVSDVMVHVNPHIAHD